MADLSGRVALVTGAGSGIGKAIALKFARCGASVAVVDVDLKTANLTAKEINEKGGKAIAVQCDVTDPQQVSSALKEIINQFGELHILVNNAGIGPATSLEQITLEEWNKVLAINLTGPFLFIKAALPLLRQAGNRGRVINMGSLAGQIGGIVAGLHYTASKGGLMAVTKQLARMLASYRVTVNSIAPGTTDTPLIQDWPEEKRAELVKQIPLGRLASVDDVANVALFLASDEAQFITGATISVNGGMYIG